MELADLFPRPTDTNAEAVKASQARRINKNNENEDGASSEDDLDDPDSRRKKGSGKRGGSVKDGSKTGTAKAFCLRSTLSDNIIQAAVKGIEDEDPRTDTIRLDEDVKGALGIAVPAQLRDWKRGDDAIFDWKTGPEQRTTMGVLYVILSLILVNERVMSDGMCYDIHVSPSIVAKG